MFNTIVVGVDGREGGRDALALAERLRALFGGELVAVHAYAHDLLANRGVNPDLESAVHATAQEMLAAEIERAGVEANAVALHDGSPGRALHRAAKWNNSDLIVVGSDHRGLVGRVLAGDVTAGTLHGAPCPVVVAPRGCHEHGTQLRIIGVGYDASPEARAAADLARDLAAAASARLRVIRVLEPPTPGGPGPSYHPDWHEHAETARERAQAQLDGLLAELGEIATGEVVVGDPVRELAYAGNELDLLVTGSRGYGPVLRVMLGSVSNQLVHQAPCPVLVLARGAEEDESGAAEALAQRPIAG